MAAKIFNFTPGFSDSDSNSDVDDFGLMELIKTRKKKGKPQPQPTSSQAKTNETASKRLCAQPVKKKPTFWEKKARAFEKFGEATLRPQDRFRKFLLHRRKMNKGENDDKWLHHPLLTPIIQSVYRPIENNAVPRQLYDNQLILVNEENTFMKMMSHLNQIKYMTVDLEANDEHSYLGMTVLIQIGTKQIDFVIDCFPVTDMIISELSVLLQNPQVVKYLFGCDNDVLWLQRDFSIYLCSAIDVQLLIQLMLQNGLFDKMTSFLSFQQRKQWYHKYIGPRRQTTPDKERLLWEMNAGAQPMSYEKIVELFYPDINLDKDAQQADFRPRNENDAQYRQLVQYARDDVHLLLQIVENMCSLDGALQIFNEAFEASKKKLMNLYKRKIYPTIDEFMLRNGTVLNDDQLNLASIIYRWRDAHARIIDESPVSMFSDHQLVSLVKNIPRNESEVEGRVKTRIGRIFKIPESIQTWQTCLFNLLTKGRTYYDQIIGIQCHNCRMTGHAAWGCSEEWNTQSTKQNLRENDAARAWQNRRRRLNKKKNEKLRRMGNQDNQQA